jgi:hypothetical protein
MPPRKPARSAAAARSSRKRAAPTNDVDVNGSPDGAELESVGAAASAAVGDVPNVAAVAPMGVTWGVGGNSTMPRTMLSPPLTGEKNAQQSKRARVDFDVGAYAAAMKLVKAGQCDCQLIL